MIEPTPPWEPPREPEVRVIDDPAEPAAPKIPELPPPVPDRPEVIGPDYDSDEHYYHAEGWEPTSWGWLAPPPTPLRRDAEHR